MNQKHSRETTIYSKQDMEQPECSAMGGGTIMVFSARAPGKETPNEDAAALIDFDADAAILVVADGLGGGPLGQSASRLAIESLEKAVDVARQEEMMLRTAILNGLEEANRAIRDLGIGAGTTMAVVELQGDVARPYHVGDSMILVVGQRGKIKLLTTSHSPVGFAVESGMLDEQEAMFHEDRHLVSNVVGTEEMKIEIGAPVKLAARDTLLLASDGLTDNLHLDEIIARVRKGPLTTVANHLAKDASERMTRPEQGLPSKPDDLTFILFRRSIGAQRKPRESDSN